MLDIRRCWACCWGGRAGWLSTENEAECDQLSCAMPSPVIHVRLGYNLAIPALLVFRDVVAVS